MSWADIRKLLVIFILSVAAFNALTFGLIYAMRHLL